MVDLFQDYIGIKHIQARPATYGEAQELLKRPAGSNDPAPDTPGYLVRYEDGYLSWSPQITFDRSHVLASMSVLGRIDVDSCEAACNLLDAVIESINDENSDL